MLEEWVDADGDGAGQKGLSKTYTIGHDVIAQAAVAALTGGVTSLDAGEAATFLYDGHGSTRALLDTAAAIVERYAYDAYGNLLSGTGLTSANTITTLLYSGEQFDARLGMQYLRTRYYNPSTGRFNR